MHIAHYDHHHNWIYHLIDLLVLHTYIVCVCAHFRIENASCDSVRDTFNRAVLRTFWWHAMQPVKMIWNKRHTKSGDAICIVVSVSHIHNQDDKQWDEKRKFDDNDDDDVDYSKNWGKHSLEIACAEKAEKQNYWGDAICWHSTPKLFKIMHTMMHCDP